MWINFRKLTKNFWKREFYCGCCGKQFMDKAFVMMLQYARDVACIPFDISSGWRCLVHNAAVGGSPGSSHMIGMAVDIRCTNSQDRWTIVMALKKAGFRRIGIGKDFIHVDNDPAKVQNVIWVY